MFVTGLEQGLVPISWATTPEQLAEERRLLHVALGRAEDALHLSWAEVRGRPTAPAAVPCASPGSSTWSSGPRPGRRRRSTAGPRSRASRAALAEASPPQPRARRVPRAR